MIKPITLLLASFILTGCASGAGPGGSISTKQCPYTTVSHLPYKGCSTVSGKVIKIYDKSEFVIQDDSGKLDVYTDGLDINKLHTGEAIKIKGQVNFPKWKRIVGFRKEIHAIELMLPDGKVIHQ